MDKIINGRMSRKPYIIIQIVILCIMSSIALIFDDEINSWDGQSFDGISVKFGLGLIMFLLMIIFNLFVTIRRFHDLDRSTSNAVAWYFASVILGIPAFYVIYLTFFKKGTDGENQYGSDPLAQ